MSIRQIAEIVKKVVEKEFNLKEQIKISTEESDDIRSYHINSDKIKKTLGFQPKRSIESAVKDLCISFKNNLFQNSFDNDYYFNVKRLKNIKAL